MPRLTIDNREVEVAEGSTLLDAAAKLGIAIPTLCFLAGHPPATSCMVCVVKLNGREGYVPACATKAADGMRVESETEEVHGARRAALELLLSDHLGDCVGPCRSVCPAHVDIPLMIRQIIAGRLADAIATVKRHVALPAVLGRICPAPCEKGCRRAHKDNPVSICLLKRYVADVDLESERPWLPPRKPRTRKKVAIVGAGPAGLAAAYYLLQAGHWCALFDDRDRAGGGLRFGVGEDRLPGEVLDAEIRAVEKLGAEFRLKTRVGRDVPIADLRKNFDALLIAAGPLKQGDAQAFGIEATQHGLKADRHTTWTGVAGVFAAGDALTPTRLTVRAVADGRQAAASICQHLAGQPLTGEHRRFSVHIGRLSEAEMAAFMTGASAAGSVPPAGGMASGFTPKEARREALRCLRCDCRKAEACKLRDHSDACGAKAGRYKGDRRPFEHDVQHPSVVYEPGKCIACGICTRITAEAGEKLGLTFVGRGFNVRVAVPFGGAMAEGLAKAARACVEACPTGALAFKDSAVALQADRQKRKD